MLTNNTVNLTTLENDLVIIINEHWDNWVKSKKKDGHLDNDFSFVDTGLPKEQKFYGLINSSYNSSNGTLWEKILYKISEACNDETYSKDEELVRNLKVHEKKWIVDLGFSRNGEHHIIEEKLGGQLDNKKSKIEKINLEERKKVLEEIVGTEVNIHLGIITNQLTNKPETWNKSTVLNEFTRGNNLLIEKELFDFVAGIDGFFEWIKTEIQPKAMRKYKEVLDEYKTFVGFNETNN